MPTINSGLPKLGARNTRQRTAVITVLRETENFSSAKSIHHALGERGEKVGLTTVYRTLQSLAEIGAVDVLHMSTGETLYRHCETEKHHHHLVCVDCGRTEEISGGPVETWARQVAADYDFELTGHDAEIFGRCRGCREKTAAAQ
ncbi:Fur family transcriptional regulator [Corynebacterium halotolerans]|uniref:Fur family transcriptional regulator n=1 Tax=Corynebacterium halotolerans TaxID=225326 RepID=UPI003CF51D3B